MSTEENPELEKSYSLEEIEDLRKEHKFDFKHTLSDAVLYLLFADDEPIKGKIKQMKEVFMALNDLLPRDSFQPVYFRKHKFGPYSEEVENTIDHLVFTNYIVVDGKRNTKNFAIDLTQKGTKHIQPKFILLPETTQKLLSKKRKEWDTHISTGILNLVYRDYAEYLENSVFKKRYAGLDWDNDEQKAEE